MLQVNNLQKAFPVEDGRVNAVRDVSFEVARGTFLTLLGPSGRGKTTTLRCVAVPASYSARQNLSLHSPYPTGSLAEGTTKELLCVSST